MLSFAFGAATSVPAMVFAYLAQLHYGNASQDETSGAADWKKAGHMHNGAYFAMALGLLFFVIGAILAAYGLTHSLITNVSRPPSS
jgi:hypothetical protein